MMRDESIEVGALPTELSDQPCQVDQPGSRVDCLEGVIPTLAGRVPFLEVRDALAHVESMTREVFGPAPYEILEREDPEAGDPLYFTLRVAFQGEAAETLKRYDDWHDRLSAIPKAMRGMFRLSVDARK